MSSPEESNPPAIKFTRKRTTTKTRTAASSARRRHNLPLVHSSEDAHGKDQHSWFARKSTMMTDQQIRSHLVSSGATKNEGGDGVSFVGDMIMGAKEEKKKKRRKSGPCFAWEEDDEHDTSYEGSHKMTAAPTLDDIMDEKDEIDLMAPLKVNKAFDATDKEQNATMSRKRPRSETLAELAIFSSTGGTSAPAGGNSSIGWNMLRFLGYRSRLGVALVPLHGFDKTKCLLDSLDQNTTHEAKWLASKRLRAIHLPSVQSNINDGSSKSTTVDVGIDTSKKKKVLVIPPPKTNKHGIGYDPFKNAPEFRAFYEHRKRLAQQQGKGIEESSTDRRKQRYLTDDVRGARRPWEDPKANFEKDDLDDDSYANDPHSGDKAVHSHYAADRNYEHLIGSKSAGGFALEDEDDTNIYDGGDAHSFPGHDKHDAELSNYALEVQSPVASDEEDNGPDSNLFGNGGTRKPKPPKSKPFDANSEDNIADAWSAWGLGIEESGGNGTLSKAVTHDGKPPLTGFIIGRKFPGSESSKQDNKSDRWEGPKVPSGFVLKRHVFTVENTLTISSDDTLNRADCGLGLDMNARSSQYKTTPPKVLPDVERQKLSSQKLVAKDGTALNFHAVRESMKDRFVSGSATTTEEGSLEASSSDKVHTDEQEEWVNVTISTWKPARLLCKRWGVAVPADVDEGAAVKRSGEVEYFQNTIYDPVVAKRRQQDAINDRIVDEKKRSVEVAEKPVAVDVQDYTESNREDAAPTRPDELVFRSIFDVQSDLDLSDEEFVNADTLQHASEVNEFDLHGRARKKRQQMAMEEEISEVKPVDHKDTMTTAPPDVEHLCSSKSSAPHKKDPSPSPSSDETSSRANRKRKQKRKHHRRFDTESDSGDSGRRRKHRSRKDKKRKKDKRER